MYKNTTVFLLLTFFCFLCSCNERKLKEREIAISKKEKELKEKELALKVSTSQNVIVPLKTNTQKEPLSNKSILNLAKKDFQQYKSRLEIKNLIVGVQEEYMGDFTGDSREDVLIYYNLEPTDGGNYIAGQGLVLYENMGDKIIFLNKYEPKYSFTFDKISNSNIYIDKVDYAEDDPRCCPSIHKTMELTLIGNKISERKR